jgi:hypothetical protein
MPTIPKSPVDLALAPVAAGIDLNLKRLRDTDPKTLVEELTLSLNTEPGHTRDERAKQVLEIATRLVDLHGWTAGISADATRLQLRGGSVDLDVGLSAGLRDYIELGPL